MKDALGNELKVGDLVMLQLKTPWVHGRIVEIAEGGLLVQGINQPGRVLVTSTHIAFADPGGALGAIVALREDQKPGESAGSLEGGIAPLPN
jgi:hypothetical protein